MRVWKPVAATLTTLIAIVCASAQTPSVSPPSTANPQVGGKTLDEWIKLVPDRDPSVSEHAIRQIGSLGSAAKRAVPALTKMLYPPKDLSPLTSAAIAIGLIAPDDPKDVKPAADALVNLLSHDQHIIKYQAATALGHIGAPARSPRAIEKLCGMIKNPMSWEIRRAAAYALGRLGRDDLNFPDMKALVALVDGIDDAAKEVRIESLQSLINLGLPTSPKDQEALKEVLQKRIRSDRDKFAAMWVRVAYLRMDAGKDAPMLVDFIAKQLKSAEPGIPADAARALGACGSIAKAKIPDLMETLKSSDVPLTVWSAWALGRMGADAKVAIPSLTTLLESADPMVKSAAQDAIKDINGGK